LAPIEMPCRYMYIHMYINTLVDFEKKSLFLRVFLGSHFRYYTQIGDTFYTACTTMYILMCFFAKKGAVQHWSSRLHLSCQVPKNALNISKPPITYVRGYLIPVNIILSKFGEPLWLSGRVTGNKFICIILSKCLVFLEIIESSLHLCTTHNSLLFSKFKKSIKGIVAFV
jgi:hypothetical protein